jgi:hypothetical protein
MAIITDRVPYPSHVLSNELYDLIPPPPGDSLTEGAETAPMTERI